MEILYLFVIVKGPKFDIYVKFVSHLCFNFLAQMFADNIEICRERTEFSASNTEREREFIPSKPKSTDTNLRIFSSSIYVGIGLTSSYKKIIIQ